MIDEELKKASDLLRSIAKKIVKHKVNPSDILSMFEMADKLDLLKARIDDGFEL